uniref:Uncharacterized protein n=1 Tax=Anguilla anguilla TaxID=7936 RepID=A0A0E9TSN4_ANGAN
MKGANTKSKPHLYLLKTNKTDKEVYQNSQR